LRVPLAVFANNVGGSLATSKCNIEITYLNPLATQSNNIILGGMFFQEFFGVFTNTYSANPETQSVQIYAGQNAMYNAYVGDEKLPAGVNPFIPVVPPAPEDKNNNWIWIVVLSVLCVLLLGGLGFAIYKWKSSAAGSANKRELVYNDATQPLANNASDDI